MSMVTQFGWILSQRVCQGNPGDAIRQDTIAFSGWHMFAGYRGDIQISELGLKVRSAVEQNLHLIGV